MPRIRTTPSPLAVFLDHILTASVAVAEAALEAVQAAHAARMRVTGGSVAPKSPVGNGSAVPSPSPATPVAIVPKRRGRKPGPKPRLVPPPGTVESASETSAAAAPVAAAVPTRRRQAIAPRRRRGGAPSPPANAVAQDTTSVADVAAVAAGELPPQTVVDEE